MVNYIFGVVFFNESDESEDEGNERPLNNRGLFLSDESEDEGNERPLNNGGLFLSDESEDEGNERPLNNRGLFLSDESDGYLSYGSDEDLL